MTLDFDNEEQYRAFTYAVAQEILCDFQFNDELERDIADELIAHHRETLAEALLDKLLEGIVSKGSDSP